LGDMVLSPCGSVFKLFQICGSPQTLHQTVNPSRIHVQTPGPVYAVSISHFGSLQMLVSSYSLVSPA